MARLKFLLFALVVLGAWAAHLYLLSPKLSARAVEQAEERATAAPAAVAVQVQERRIELQRAALAVAGNAQALGLLQPSKGGKIEAPTAEKLAAFMASLGDGVPAHLQKSLVVILANEAGAIAGRGDGAPVSAEDLNVAALTHAGGDGVTREAFGQSHLFYSLPVTAGDKVVGHVVLGAPLVSDELIEAVAKETGIGAVGVLKDGKVLHAAGPQKALVQAASAKIAVGRSDVLERGMVEAMGPLKLPVLTREQDMMGGAAPLWVSARQPLQATPFEVVTIASVGPFMSTLAEYQKLAVFAFSGIFLLAVVFLLVMGGDASAKKDAERDEGESPAQAAQRVPGAQLPEAVPSPAAASSPEPAPAPSSLPPPVAPEHLPFAQQGELHAWPPPPPTGELAPAHGEEGFPPAPSPAPTVPGDAAAAFAQDDSQPTMAYPTGANPFELAARQAAPVSGDSNFNPEATRVATIPQELLLASARPANEPSESPRLSAPFPAPPPPAAANPEEAHFQEVFREFMRTREQCGEPPDGLTYDKFALKLRKNKEQLIAKYNCRTVRFQVYVKEGRAALKATPIKE